MLQGEKIDPKEIDAMLRNLRQLNDERVYKDVEELARLQAQVTDSAKRVEYDLRRKVEGADAQLLLSGSRRGAREVPQERRAGPIARSRRLPKPPRLQRASSRLSESSKTGGDRPRCPCAASSPSASSLSWGPSRWLPVCRRRTTFSSNGDSGRRRSSRPTTASTGRSISAGCTTRACAASMAVRGGATDYPDADYNFMIRLSELTKTRVSQDLGWHAESSGRRPRTPRSSSVVRS